MGWSHIGGPTRQVYDSLQNLGYPMLFRTDPSDDPNITGPLYVFAPSAGWERISDPGSMFAVNDRYLFRLNPNKDAVFLRLGVGHAENAGWERLGGPANTIIAGDGSVALYTDQTIGDLHRYGMGKIGGPGYMFAISGSRSFQFLDEDFEIYGVTPNQTQIWRFMKETGWQWEHLTPDVPGNQLRVRGVGPNGAGSRIRSIIAGVSELYAVAESLYQFAQASTNIYRYLGSGNWTLIGSGLGYGDLAVQIPLPHADSRPTVDILFSFNPIDRTLRQYTGTGWQVISYRRQINPQFGPGADRVIERIFSGYRRILVTLSDDDLWQYSQD